MQNAIPLYHARPLPSTYPSISLQAKKSPAACMPTAGGSPRVMPVPLGILVAREIYKAKVWGRKQGGVRRGGFCSLVSNLPQISICYLICQLFFLLFLIMPKQYKKARLHTGAGPIKDYLFFTPLRHGRLSGHLLGLPKKASLFRDPCPFQSSGGINPPSGKKIPGQRPGILLGRA